MILLKPFLILAGSVAGTVGITSLSSLKDWDSSHVWRVSAKDKFYLFTCKQSDSLDKRKTEAHWKESEMQVYLKFKDGDRTLKNDQELKLEGVGYSLSKNIKNQIENLHASDAGSRNQSTFVLTLFDSGNAWLGELGGDHSHNYGDALRCGKSLINIDNKAPKTQEEISFKDVSFKLKECGPSKDNKRQECSIDIIHNSGVSKKLEWVDNFKPIVIN